MHPTRFVYQHYRLSALGAAEAAPATNTGSLVWPLRSGHYDSHGQYPKEEVYDALLFYSDVTFTYELAYWHTTLRVWVIVQTGTITGGTPLTVPWPYEAAEIYFRRTSVTVADAHVYCQPKQASITSVAVNVIAILAALTAVEAAEDSPHVSGEMGLKVWRVRRDVPANSASSDGDYCTPNQDADGYDYMRGKAYDGSANADRVGEIAPVWSRNVQTPVSIAAAQAITAAWADLGTGVEIGTQGYSFIALWLNVDVNDSQNVRIRALAKHTAAGSDEYQFPIMAIDVSATPFNVKVEGDYAELNVDADQKVILIYRLWNCIPYVQFQVMAEVAGASPGAITTAYVTYGFGGAS